MNFFKILICLFLGFGLFEAQAFDYADGEGEDFVRETETPPEVVAETLPVMSFEGEKDSQKFKYAVPIREIAIIVGNEGYFPNQISAFVGEKVRFLITTLTDRPTCLLMKDQNLFLSAMKGKIIEANTQFKETGVYPFYCPGWNFKGRITILEKPSLQNKKRKFDQWMPKDY